MAGACALPGMVRTLATAPRNAPFTSTLMPRIDPGLKERRHPHGVSREPELVMPSLALPIGLLLFDVLLMCFIGFVFVVWFLTALLLVISVAVQRCRVQTENARP